MSNYFLLKARPTGELALINSDPEPISRPIALKLARKHITATLAAGGEPEPLLLVNCTTPPIPIDAGNLELLEKELVT